MNQNKRKKNKTGYNLGFLRRTTTHVLTITVTSDDNIRVQILLYEVTLTIQQQNYFQKKVYQ